MMADSFKLQLRKLKTMSNETTSPVNAGPAVKKAAVKKVAAKSVKPVKKVAGKKAAPAKSTRAPSNANNPFKRFQATAAGCTTIQLAILNAVCGSKDGLTYQGIKAKTGYYSILTANCRAGKDGSLCTLGYMKEEVREGEGLTFVATAAGRKALEKGKAAKE